jgi:hypothetical protein
MIDDEAVLGSLSRNLLAGLWNDKKLGPVLRNMIKEKYKNAKISYDQDEFKKIRKETSNMIDPLLVALWGFRDEIIERKYEFWKRIGIELSVQYHWANGWWMVG